MHKSAMTEGITYVDSRCVAVCCSVLNLQILQIVVWVVNSLVSSVLILDMVSLCPHSVFTRSHLRHVHIMLHVHQP